MDNVINKLIRIHLSQRQSSAVSFYQEQFIKLKRDNCCIVKQTVCVPCQQLFCTWHRACSKQHPKQVPVIDQLISVYLVAWMVTLIKYLVNHFCLFQTLNGTNLKWSSSAEPVPIVCGSNSTNERAKFDFKVSVMDFCSKQSKNH